MTGGALFYAFLHLFMPFCTFSSVFPPSGSSSVFRPPDIFLLSSGRQAVLIPLLSRLFHYRFNMKTILIFLDFSFIT